MYGDWLSGAIFRPGMWHLYVEMFWAELTHKLFYVESLLADYRIELNWAKLFPAMLWPVYTFVYLTTVRYVIFSWFHSDDSEVARWQIVPLTGAGFALLGAYSAGMASMGFAHLSALLSDPGIVPHVEAPPANVQHPRCCTFCSGRPWKPSRAHHCRECGVCIFQRHSHCPFIGNCVGQGNQKPFLLLLLYGGASLSASLLLLASGLVAWAASGLTALAVALVEAEGSAGTVLARGLLERRPPLGALVCGPLAARACSRGLDQLWHTAKDHWRCLRTNATPLEADRGLFGPPRTPRARLREVFGPEAWLWPVPLPARVAPDLSEPVFRWSEATGLMEEVFGKRLSPGAEADEWGRSAAGRRGGRDDDAIRAAWARR
ncbi:unnamed protein product [Prorocentrum cordatum]|uniref:Palmitoyltransferase n=1 Tax=Prorocentrum cordatum TaxID=2364126 RepID=A0ABN9UMM6_9DINO|nr:unnamed protein product [Polarella glacialis]